MVRRAVPPCDGAVLLSIALQYGVPLDMIRGATTRNPPGPRHCPGKGWRPWSQKNASVAKKVTSHEHLHDCAPGIPETPWSARNDSSVCCASMSRSPAAMARRVFLSRSTKWRRDDEPLEPQARCPSRIPSRTRVERGIHHIAERTPLERDCSQAGYFAGATSLTGVPSASVFSPCLLAAFRSRSIRPARRSCTICVSSASFFRSS
jgi:hypothetical protein